MQLFHQSWVCSRHTGVSHTEVRAKRLVRGRFYQGEDGKTWDRKDMLSIDLMAMLSGPPMFMDMGVVMATGWAMFMDAEAGMLTEAMFTGPVMVTGCCRLTGDVILTVLVEMFIWAAMVTGLLVWPRFIAVVMGDETETGVEAELQTSVLSVEDGEREAFNTCVQGLCVFRSQTLWVSRLVCQMMQRNL